MIHFLLSSCLHNNGIENEHQKRVEVPLDDNDKEEEDDEEEELIQDPKYQPPPEIHQYQPEPAAFSDKVLGDLIDDILKLYDINDDGYLDYAEFRISQRDASYKKEQSEHDHAEEP